jgi:hypothetical protein
MDDEAKKRRLANLRPFKPGESGNPGGRSKAQNGKPGEAAMAANSLLDRGWGKPHSPRDIDDCGAKNNTQSPC